MYRDPITNKRGTKKSIDKLKQKLNLGFEHVNRKELTLKKYLLNFFDFNKSPYFSRKILLDKDSISPDYVSTRRNAIENHIIPLLNDSFLVSEVNLAFLEEIQTKLILKKKLSSTSINQIMNSLSQALEYAKKDNLLPYNQPTKVESIRKNIKVRGILSNDETKQLISYLKSLKDPLPYLSISLALVTGMRSGELRALTTDQIKNGTIVIDRAYANIAKTKWK